MRAGRIGAKNEMARLLIVNTIIAMKSRSQKMFSTAAIRLEVLVTSTPRIGRNRNVETMYGALQAIQKYVSNFVDGLDTSAGFSLGQLWVSITEAASS